MVSPENLHIQVTLNSVNRCIYVFRNTGTYVTIEKEVANLKGSKGGYIGGLIGRKGESKCDYIIT